MKTLLSKITRFIRRSLLEGISLKNTALEQVVLTNQYRLMKKLLKPKEMPTFSDIGFASTSQFEEDGILLYIFSLIKSTNRRVVEICAGPGSECMAANLILNHGWEALLFDGDENLVAKGNTSQDLNHSSSTNPNMFMLGSLRRISISLLLTMAFPDPSISLA